MVSSDFLGAGALRGAGAGAGRRADGADRLEHRERLAQRAARDVQGLGERARAGQVVADGEPAALQLRRHPLHDRLVHLHRARVSQVAARRPQQMLTQPWAPSDAGVLTLGP